MHRNKKQQPNPTQVRVRQCYYTLLKDFFTSISFLQILRVPGGRKRLRLRLNSAPSLALYSSSLFKFQQHHLVPPGQIRRKILNMSTKPLSSFMESWDYCTVFCFFYCLLVNICHKNDLLPLEPNHWACHHFTFVVADITHSNLLENSNSIGI